MAHEVHEIGELLAAAALDLVGLHRLERAPELAGVAASGGRASASLNCRRSLSESFSGRVPA